MWLYITIGLTLRQEQPMKKSTSLQHQRHLCLINVLVIASALQNSDLH